jgi:hypothetical protein
MPKAARLVGVLADVSNDCNRYDKRLCGDFVDVGAAQGDQQAG